jgi:hypothetical protein
VTPGTFLRWIREASTNKEPGKAGRRRRIDVRKLIVKLARENPGWGYTRVLGELRKLTAQKVSRQFVANVMREHGFDPGPWHGEKTWDEFLKIPRGHTLAMRLLSHKVLTLSGVRELFVIARWIQSIQIECLNQFVVLGEKHFNYVVSTYVNYYLGHRPHQGLDNKPLDGSEPDDDVPPLTNLRRQSWLGGLLKSYSRKAA